MNTFHRIRLVTAFTWLIISCGKTTPSPVPDNPEELIRSYYEAAERLDYEYMEACLRRPGKDPLTGEVANVSTLTRIRRGTENREVFMPAGRWLEEGRKDIPDHMILYGITDIHIEPLGGDSWSASFRKWSGEGEDIRVHDIMEYVTVEDLRGRIYITRIERKEESLIPRPSRER